MSTPAWVRRLSDTSDSLKEFGLPSVSLYKPGLSDSRTSLESQAYMSRSIENVSDGRNTYINARNRQKEDRSRSPRQRGYLGDIESRGLDVSRHGRGDGDATDRFKNEPDKYSERRERSGNPMPSTSDQRFDIKNERHAQSRNRGEVSSSPLPGKDRKLYKDAQGLGNKGYSDSKLQVHTGEKYVKRGNRREPKREDSWSYVDSDDVSHTSHSLHTSASYGDFDAKSSTVSGSSYMRGNRSDHSLPLSEQDRKRKRRPREDDAPTSSGYNSYSEMSEFANTSRSSKQRKSTNSLTLNDKHHSDIDDEKYLKIPRNSSSGRLDDSNHLRVPKQSKTSLHFRSDSKLSMSGSEPSTKVSSSGVRKKKTDKSSPHKCSHNEKISTPTIGNVSVTVNNNVNYDPNDPFSFIQPVEIPFYAKVRKCLGPLAAVLLVVVLAGALGAAIYFASALKETQEKQIDILRANLAVKIRTIDSIENMDDLSGSQLRDLSMDHCTQMDRFYAASSFRNTYRGCEVVSIKNHSINFTLFFAEKEATTTQIIGVIETSADKKPDAKPELTVVGKLSLELNNAEITMDRRMEPETFDKKTGIIVITTTTLKPADKAETTTPQPTAQASPVAPPIGVPTPASAGILKPQPSDLRVYSWDPCASFNGSYFPHPTECDQYFQCSNGASILQNCTAGLLYHWNKTTCVSRFMLGVSEQCPDAKRAPPKPMPTTPSTTTSTTPSTTTSTTMPQRPTKQITKTTTNTLATTKTTNKPAMTVNFFTGPSTMDPFLADFLDHNAETTHGPNANALILTAIAALSLHRPKYTMTPCSGNDVQLYPYPDDCAKFIQCVNGKTQIRNCSHGLVFDSAINACIIPPNKELLCPDIKPCSTTKEGYFSHPFDCTKFIQCDRNQEIVRSCPHGFYWDEEINACLAQKPKRKCYSNLPESTI